MPQQVINIGALPNDGNGDPLRVAFGKINTNFSELYLTAGAQGPEGAVQFRAPATLVAVVELAGTFLAAAQDRLYISTDGVSWTAANSPLDVVTCATTTNNSFVVAGLGGKIYSSVDGISWFDISLPSSVSVRSIAYAAATPSLIAVGDSGAIWTSNNALTWTARTSGTAQNLLSVTYSNSTLGYVAVGVSGTILQSADAIIWNVVPTAYSEDLRGITWDGTYLVAVGESGLITASPDAFAWSTRTSGVIDDLNTIQANDISGNTWLYAYGNNGRGIRSDDSVAWSTIATGTTQNLNAGTYTGNLFVTVGANGTIITSAAGTLWTDQSLIPEVQGNSNFVWQNQSQVLSLAGNIIPQTTNAYTLGNSSSRWANASVVNFNATGYVNLGGVGSLTVLGGSNGYVLSTDGTGNLSWIQPSDAQYKPGGASGTVQFNNSGNFAGSNAFTFNSGSNTVTIANLTVANIANLGSVANVKITGGTANYVLSTDGSGNLSWIEGGQRPAGSNTQVQFNNNNVFGGTNAFTWNNATNTLTATNLAGNGFGIFGVDAANLVGTVQNTIYAEQVTDSAQPNITSVGTMSFLNMTGPFTSNANLTAANIRATNRMTVGNRFDATTASNVALGYVGNIRITGGLNGYVLTTDGLGNLSWTDGGGGGNGGDPGGSNGQVQFNNAGEFGGSPYLTWNDVTQTFTVGGNVVANALEIGSGIYKFSHTNVYFATSSTTANSELIKFDCDELQGLDFTIIATNPILGSRQISKMTAVIYDENLQYNEYCTLLTNGLVGNFTMAYDPGNLVVSPAARLYVEPANVALTTYKIMITRYE